MEWRKQPRLYALSGLALAGAALFFLYDGNGQAVLDQTKASGIAAENAALYRFHGMIHGTVRYASGKPAGGFRVRARFVHRATGARGEGFAMSDAFGNYTIRGLTDRQQGSRTEFQVSVENEGKPFVARVASVPVTITPYRNARSGVDFVLEAGPEITVRVRDAETGAPVAGLPIEANQSAWWSPEPCGVTDANGEFVYHSPNRQNTLRINTEKPKRLSIAPAPGYNLSYREELAPGQKAVWEVRTYAHAYTSKETIFQGVVKDGDGNPLSCVALRLLVAQREQRATTDAEGRFSFPIQRIMAPSDKSGTVLILEKGGETMVRFVRAADTWGPLALTWRPSETATVVGQVREPNGKPLPGVPINYHEMFWNPQFREPGVSADRCYSGGNGGVTDADGRFALRGLHPEAVYSLEFGRRYQDGNPQGFGLTHFPDPPYKGVFLHLLPNEVRDLATVTVPRAEGVVGGRLIGVAGESLHRGVHVVARGKHTDHSAAIQPDASFRIGGVADEPLELLVFRSDDGSFRTASDSPDIVVRLPVRYGDTALRVVVPPGRKPGP